VWGTNGIKYLDCSMKSSSVSLGDAHELVFESMIEETCKGSNFHYFSCPEYEMVEFFYLSSHSMT
jgi:4-aminobutyrate aminotransferase-like enzyme